MMRKLVLTGMIGGMVCMASFTAHAAGVVEPARYLTLDDTLWELQNDIIEGVSHIGFYGENIYACNSRAITLCLPLPYSEYDDFLIISFFKWEISGDIIKIGFNGIAFPLLGIGFLKTETGDFSVLIKRDNDWKPFPY